MNNMYKICSRCSGHYLRMVMPKTRSFRSNTRHFGSFVKTSTTLHSGLRQEFKIILRYSSSSNQPDNDDRSESRSTFSAEEVAKFNVFAGSWWDEQGEAVALHTLNYLRVPFVCNGLLQEAGQSERIDTTAQPLTGFKLLDVGCGGGILSEAMARLGATVTGIDALSESIDTAKWHLSKSRGLEVEYRCCLVEELAERQELHFDGIVCSEVIEHVADPAHFVSCCDKILKPGGSMFFTTINKTPLAYALAVVAAERIFSIVPTGTHDYEKFVSPLDLEWILKNNGLNTRRIHGMTLNPLTMKWRWIQNTSVNYALHAVKGTDATE